MAAYEFIDSTGTVVADTSTTKTGIQEEFKSVFGADIDLDDETPEGALINAETIARNGVALNNATLANQINPNIAEGVFFDAIWALTRGLTGGRKAATPSTFSQPVDLTGVPGTIIPESSIAITVNGDEFITLSEVTLDGTGNASVAFQSLENGEIFADAGELNTVGFGAPLGWETVNNPVDATAGSVEENDEESRLRRIDTLALQGISLVFAIKSAISDLDGVKSLEFRENFTKLDDTIDGVFLLANSIYVAVDGGSDQDIADTLRIKKTAGTNWNGAVSVNSTDPDSGQIYDVRFDRPIEIQAFIRVTILKSDVSNPANVVETSVLRYANGLIDGERGFVVGNDVSPFEIAGAINIDTPQITVKLVELSTNGLDFFLAEIPIKISEVARTSSGQITTIIL